MGLVVKPFTFVNGTIADATEVNPDFDTLYTLVNGNIDSANIDLTDAYVWTGAHTFTVPPTIGDFTNANHNHENVAGGGTISIVNATTGVLPVSRGGSGSTSSTGTGNTVLSNSPTIVTPTIASFVNANHDHSNATNGGLVSHAVLTNLTTGDPHTQYLAKAGGTMTGNIAMTGTGTVDGIDISEHKHEIGGSTLSQTRSISYTLASPVSPSNYADDSSFQWIASRNGTATGQLYFETDDGLGLYNSYINTPTGVELWLIDDNTGGAYYTISSINFVSGNEYYFQLTGSPDISAYTTAQNARFCVTNHQVWFKQGAQVNTYEIIAMMEGVSAMTTTINVAGVASTDLVLLSMTGLYGATSSGGAVDDDEGCELKYSTFAGSSHVLLLTIKSGLPGMRFRFNVTILPREVDKP